MMESRPSCTTTTTSTTPLQVGGGGPGPPQGLPSNYQPPPPPASRRVSSRPPTRPHEVLDPKQELEVIKAILLRESYLARLQDSHDRAYYKAQKALKAPPRDAKNPAGTTTTTTTDEVYLVLPPDMIDLLDLIRTATIEVVEAIQRWKLARLNPDSQYIWNGHNYLLRIPTDLSYLQTFPPLSSWLRFDMIRNPFIIRQPMTGSSNNNWDQEDQVVEVGAYEPSYLILPRPKIKPPRPLPSPYLTPVINDLDMIPILAKQAKSIHSNFNPWKKPDPLARPNEIHASSLIKGVDLERIRRAEAFIVQEEVAFGRYTRDGRGELILTDAGPHDPTTNDFLQTSSFETSTGDGVVMTKTRWSWSRRRGKRRLTPLDEEPGAGLEDVRDYNDENMEEIFLGRQPICKKYPTPHVPTDAPDNPPALKRAKKMASDLFLLTAAGTSGRMKALARPNRFLRIEQEMAYLNEEIAENHGLLANLAARVSTIQAQVFTDRNIKATCEEEMVDDDDPIPIEVFEGGLSLSEWTTKLRHEMDELLRETELLEEATEKRQRELDFKMLCKGYLEQVKKHESDKQAAVKLLKARVRLRDGEVLPEDEQVAITLEDRAAALIQRRVRGVITRSNVRQYRVAKLKSTTIIQSIIRGWKGRRIAKLAIKKRIAAIRIQAVYRAHRFKPHLHMLQRARLESSASTSIQRIVRGVLGRRRAQYRRDLVRASENAMAAVDHRGLIPDDILELGERLLFTLTDPSQPFPPPAVLGLLRLVMVLLDSNTPDIVTSYSFIGSRSQYLTNNTQLTWNNAMRLLRRSSRFIRKLRFLAADPLHIPPRILYVPPQALELAHNLRQDPDFTEVALAKIGPGAKCAVGLFRYYTNLEQVYFLQTRFALDRSNCIPQLLIQIRRVQERRRANHLEFTIKEASVKEANMAMELRLTQSRRYGFEKEVLLHEESLKAAAQLKVEKDDGKLQSLFMRLGKAGTAQLASLQEAAKYIRRRQHMVKRERELAEAEAVKGSIQARLLLKSLQQDEYRVNEELKNKNNEIDVCMEAKRLRLQQAHGSPTYPQDFLEAARAKGRTQSRYQIAQKYRDEFVACIGGRYYIPTLDGQSLETYRELQQPLIDLNADCKRITKDLEERMRMYEEEVHGADIDGILDDIQPRRWDQPTDIQVAQEADEDERCARHEAATLQDFLLPDVKASLSEEYLGVEGKTIKSSPILIVIARDCPKVIKDKVYAAIEQDFPGIFQRFGPEDLRASHIEMWKYQLAFTEGKHAIIEADPGSTLASRRAFMAAMFALKSGLNPNPRSILVTGTEHDKAGLGCDWAERVIPDDLDSLKDSKVKILLQALHENLFQLSQRRVLDDLKQLLDADSPPTNHRILPGTYIIVLKAMLILLHPRGRHPGPHKIKEALVWQACRILLRRPKDLSAMLYRLEYQLIPPETLDIVQEYLSHPSWPRQDEMSTHDEPFLLNLAQWVSRLIEYLYLLAPRGGKPEAFPAMFKEDLFSAVIGISSRPSASGEFPLSEALPMLARYIALDTRVYVDVIRGVHGLQLVQCYQFKTRILFTVYNPVLSQWDYCFINIPSVGKLLEPNYCDEEKFNIKYPPRNRDQLYYQLIQLLHYENVWRDGVMCQELVCDRETVPLFECWRKIGGHIVNMVGYEKGKGELCFDLNMPNEGPGVSHCVITFPQLIELHSYGDKELEKPLIEALAAESCSTSEDIDVNEMDSKIIRVLHPVMERLRIKPTALTMAEHGLSSDPIRKLLGKEWPVKARASLRKGGGPGRLLFRRTVRASFPPYMPHVVSVMECGGPGGLLRILVYDLISSTTEEIRVSSAERAYMLPPVGGDYTSEGMYEREHFIYAVLSRIHVHLGPDGASVIRFDVLTYDAKRTVPGFPSVKVWAGMDPREELFMMRVEVGDMTRECCMSLEEGWEAWRKRLGYEVEGDSTDGLVKRFFDDWTFRAQVFVSVANCIQHHNVEGWDMLYLVVGERWEALFTGGDIITQGEYTDTSMTFPSRHMHKEEATRAVDAVVECIPKLIKSLWERRLVARIRGPLQIQELIEGEESPVVQDEGEVRVWEAITGGEARPERVFHFMAIDLKRKARAVVKVVGQEAIEKLVEPDQRYLLESDRQRDLVDYLARTRIRLVVKHLGGYDDKLTCWVTFREPPPFHKPAPLVPKTVESPKGKCFLLSGLPVTLMVSESLTITGRRIRLLAYLVDRPKPKGRDVVFIAVQRLEGSKSSLTMPLTRILNHVGLDESDVDRNPSGLKEILHGVASYLKFNYPRGGGPPQLVLPYMSLTLSPSPAEAADQ